MTALDRTNGFRVRGLNADTDKLAVQSSHQTTFFLTRAKWGGMLPKWHEIGLGRSELIVLRPYGGAPVIELEALGGPYGVLVVEATQSCTRTLRNGQRLRLELKRDESVVIKCEEWKPPGKDGAQFERV